ncbi:DNA topoisomerase I, partial [Phenoliferia sp. Uapishka_3]
MASYKKRVIQRDSSSEPDDDIPQPKRAKADDEPSPPTLPIPPTTTAAPAPTSNSNPSTSALVAAVAAAAENERAKLAIFTTGSDDSDDEDDDKPLASKANGKSNGNGSKKRVKDEEMEESKAEEDSEEDEKPLAQKVKAAAKPPAAKKQKKSSASSSKATTPDDDNDSSEDDKPLADKAAKSKSKAKPKAAKPRASTSKKVKKPSTSDEEDDADDDSGSDAPLAAKKKKAAPKKAAAAKKEKKVKPESSASPQKPKGKGKAKAKKEEGQTDGEEVKSEDEVYKWWENEDDGVTKWKTLEHNGVLFPPEYEPHGIKMKYNGKPVSLPPEAEEVCSFFAAILETDYPKNPVFVKNFFSSWLEVLKKHPPLDGTKITNFEDCDFTPIFGYLEGEKAKKKEMTSAEKKLAKAARDIVEEPYKVCLLDGRKEIVGNFRVEPPGLFRGRGEHPKTGLLKTRVRPEQITINIGKDAKVPQAPEGHKWKDIVHDDKVTWLATWKENINGAVKYVFLAAGSSLKGQSDFKKFEKARALKEHIDRIRRDYTADLKHKEMVTRQRATAIYLIDRFALRNGNEKGEEEADTVGCCSLRFEHVTLEPPTAVTFDFLGKDSIRYTNRVEVDEQVFKNLKIFKKEPKQIGDLLFDRLSTSMVNKYLTSYMEGLTAKVFRTYNASWTFVQELKDTPDDASIADKILAYNRANRRVAVLCNHQRSVSKGHGLMMEKLSDKTRALKYQRKKLRCALLASGDKKKYKEFTEDESDLEDDWIVEHEAQLVILEREKIRKKFEKENKKLTEENEKAQPDSELKERLKVADDLEKTLKAERKKGWKESKLSDDKIVLAIRKIDDRIQISKTNITDRDEGKEVSLGTSKINYIDPRLTVQWAAKHEVPLAKLFSKTLITKFAWAMSVPADFE